VLAACTACLSHFIDAMPAQVLCRQPLIGLSTFKDLQPPSLEPLLPHACAMALLPVASAALAPSGLRHLMQVRPHNRCAGRHITGLLRLECCICSSRGGALPPCLAHVVPESLPLLASPHAPRPAPTAFCLEKLNTMLPPPALSAFQDDSPLFELYNDCPECNSLSAERSTHGRELGRLLRLMDQLEAKVGGSLSSARRILAT
jgi:hypothetical protein